MSIITLTASSAKPCAVEQFTAKLTKELGAQDGQVVGLSLPGSILEFAALWRLLFQARTVIVNAPVVAWKRRIVTPMLTALLVRLRRRDLVVILHEWADLDWRRRLVLAPVLWSATQLFFSAPRVDRQIRDDGLSRWLTSRRGLVPIPPNLLRPPVPRDNPIAQRVRALRVSGRIVVGQFGSLYPTKDNTALLDVAAELRRRGRDVFIVFVGDFIRGTVPIEEQFWGHAHALGIEDHVWVTGFIDEGDDVFAILDEIGMFVYQFPDGLTPNRSSILTCLQTRRPIVVNAPRSEGEFDHHPAFAAQIAGGRLRLVPTDASAAAFADAVEAEAATGASEHIVDPAEMWNDVVRVIAAGSLSKSGN